MSFWLYYVRWSSLLFFQTFDQVRAEIFRRFEELGQRSSEFIEIATVSDVRVHVLFQVFFDEPVQVIAVLLEVWLPLLEESFANLSEILVVVVAVCVGPFENLTALDYSLTTVLQEF